jgi:hypothetical protein
MAWASSANLYIFAMFGIDDNDATRTFSRECVYELMRRGHLLPHVESSRDPEMNLPAEEQEKLHQHLGACAESTIVAAILKTKKVVIH